MFFETFADFMAMGRHGPYVWSCYAIVLVVVLLNVWAPIKRRKNIISQYQRLQRREK